MFQATVYTHVLHTIVSHLQGWFPQILALQLGEACSSHQVITWRGGLHVVEYRADCLIAFINCLYRLTCCHRSITIHTQRSIMTELIETPAKCVHTTTIQHLLIKALETYQLYKLQEPLRSPSLSSTSTRMQVKFEIRTLWLSITAHY